ncbi:hypothetical protein AK34_3627 [Burkholderia dolosa AU0158]|nr:hypothetical protein AK34_3627 [Burkholderia dolosa AU0158]VWB99367.1 hypothetical protein BDO18943_04748 [Burkholderia dolosa]
MPQSVIAIPRAQLWSQRSSDPVAIKVRHLGISSFWSELPESVHVAARQVARSTSGDIDVELTRTHFRLEKKPLASVPPAAVPKGTLYEDEVSGIPAKNKKIFRFDESVVASDSGWHDENGDAVAMFHAAGGTDIDRHDVTDMNNFWVASSTTVPGNTLMAFKESETKEAVEKQIELMEKLYGPNFVKRNGERVFTLPGLPLTDVFDIPKDAGKILIAEIGEVFKAGFAPLDFSTGNFLYSKELQRIYPITFTEFANLDEMTLAKGMASISGFVARRSAEH